jgi:hypothetical protein
MKGILSLILIAFVYVNLCANTDDIQYHVKGFQFNVPFDGYFIEKSFFDSQLWEPYSRWPKIMEELTELRALQDMQNNLQFWNNVWFYSFIGTGVLLVASVIYIIVTALIPRPALGVRF